MQLNQQDAELFYKLMWSLQAYVNNEHGIYPDIATPQEYSSKVDRQEKMKVRDALWADLSIIDSFVQDNPDRLSEDELEIVKKWKNGIHGSFFIERLLKKYAVFIKDEEVYAVLGLTQPIQEIYHPSWLPLYVQTILLPFKGRIIYDGMIKPYNMSFGGGVKHELKETYMRAKQNNRIIETFDPEKRKKKEQKTGRPPKDYTSELEELEKIAKKMRSSSRAPAIYSPAFKLIRESIKFAQSAVDNPKDTEALYDRLDKVEKAVDRSETVLFRTE